MMLKNKKQNRLKQIIILALYKMSKLLSNANIRMPNKRVVAYRRFLAAANSYLNLRPEESTGVKNLRSNYRAKGTNTDYWNARADEYIKMESEISAEAQFYDAVNLLLEANNFQAILDLVLSGKGVLTEEQAGDMWSKLRNTGKYNLKLTKIFNGLLESNFVTVSEMIKDWFMSFLTLGSRLEAVEQPTYGSDITDTYKFSELTTIKINKFGVPNRVLENKAAGFFVYTNTTNLDLSRYQIYNEQQTKDKRLIDEREHCLIEALKLSGVDDALIMNVKSTFVDEHKSDIKRSDLKKVADIIMRNIIINIMHNENGKMKIKKSIVNASVPAGDNIEIAIFKNHYFIFENTIYSRYCINNYGDVKDEEDKHNIIKKRSTGTYDRKPDIRKINSLQLAYKLFSDGYFKKMSLIYFPEKDHNKDTKDEIYLDNIENEQFLCLNDAEKEKIRLENRAKKEAEKLAKKEAKNKKSGKKRAKKSGKKRTKKEPKNNKKSDKKREEPLIYYADCETYITTSKHELQLLGFVSDKSDWVNIYNVNDAEFNKDHTSKEQLLVYRWLKDMTRNGKRNVICYYHNLKYDYNILQKYLNVTDQCIKENFIYSVKIKYGKSEIELRDSNKLLPFALKDFTRNLELDKKYCKKEAIAYDYYTEKNDNKIIKVEKYKSFLPIDEYEIFEDMLKNSVGRKFNLFDYDAKKRTFNPLKYYKYYLKFDCLVLKKGVQKFDKIIKEITKGQLSVYDKLTISSLTDKYMKDSGAYEGVYELFGNIREYVSKAIYGGRVCVNKKYKGKIVTGRISDYDGVSFYPSAINRLCRESGLPKGKAKRFTKDDLKNWNRKTYSIVTVKIKAVNKIQQMPFIAHKSDKSIKYSNEAPKEPVIIDKITLEDYIKFHKIDYEILDGVYWDEGVNKKMGVIINELFDARLKFKKQKALYSTIKLMLNSAYGKTATKKVKTKRIIVRNTRREKNKETGEWETKTDLINDYIYNRFGTVISYRPINDDKYEVIEKYADTSNNRAHIACAILSMSKRIMNEIFDIANTLNLPIYYSDTDSLHCNLDDLPAIEALYEKEYNKVLRGNKLEQFNTDFELEGSKKGAEVYAKQSIFLDKKSYIDVLESVDENDKLINGYHFRLKGITKAGLTHEAKKYNGDYFEMYKLMSKGKPIKFILNPYDKENNKKKAMFKFGAGEVSTIMGEFTRTVVFDNEAREKIKQRKAKALRKRK